MGSDSGAHRHRATGRGDGGHLGRVCLRGPQTLSTRAEALGEDGPRQATRRRHWQENTQGVGSWGDCQAQREGYGAECSHTVEQVGGTGQGPCPGCLDAAGSSFQPQTPAEDQRSPGLPTDCSPPGSSVHGLPTDCSLPGSSVHGILQVRILEWVTMPFSRGSSHPVIKPGSPALQADSLASEPPGKLVALLDTAPPGVSENSPSPVISTLSSPPPSEGPGPVDSQG